MTAASQLALPSIAVRQKFPRLRYMGSKYRLLPHLEEIFGTIAFDSGLDAFSGSGVVAHALKQMGKRVVTNDFLQFASTIGRATVENSHVRLSPQDVRTILSPSRDGRDFIARTFEGLYFQREDLTFLDAAWSHIDEMSRFKQAIAISALCLASARKQPRGVFTVTSLRYDDGRRALRLPLAELFVEAVNDYNATVFDNGQPCEALCADVFSLPTDFDLVYLDPPYAPPKDDNCYIKRYHFLEGLSCYWRGQRILEDTMTKKLEKRFTPFSYKSTIQDALERVFDRFRESTIVLSYSTNSVPATDDIRAMLGRVKRRVDIPLIPHRYSFGTHKNAARRTAGEIVFVGR